MSRKHMVRTSFTRESQEDLLVIAMEIKNKLALNIAVFSESDRQGGRIRGSGFSL